jgi:hypothetical protein
MHTHVNLIGKIKHTYSPTEVFVKILLIYVSCGAILLNPHATPYVAITTQQTTEKNYKKCIGCMRNLRILYTKQCFYTTF